MTTRPWAWPSVLATATLLWMSPGWAQAPSALKLGFDAAWARMPEQRAAPLRKDAAAAAAAAAQRWTPDAPALEMMAKTDRIVRNEGERKYEAALAVPLWLPGERARAQAAAGAGAEAVNKQLLAAQWRLAADVREAYWAYQRARNDLDLAQQRLTNANQIAADVARRVNAGDLARADSHQAEAAAAAAESATAQADVALTDAAQAWSSLTGAPPAGGGAEPRPEGDAALHPALAELSAKAELARRQRDLAGVQSRANPELTVGTIRERGGMGERYHQSVAVGLRIPLGKHSGRAARMASAGADLAEAEGQLELEQHRMQSELEAARTRIAALEKAHAAAERRAGLARESRGFFDKSFRLGETDLPTRLRIELEAAEAERQAARSRVERDAAISHLRQALGLLPE